MLLVGIDVILNVIHPFYRFVGQGMMEDLKYPMKGNTVPFWAVPVRIFFPDIVHFVLTEIIVFYFLSDILLIFS